MYLGTPLGAFGHTFSTIELQHLDVKVYFEDLCGDRM